MPLQRQRACRTMPLQLGRPSRAGGAASKRSRIDIEELARHRASPRRRRPLLPGDCTTLGRGDPRPHGTARRVFLRGRTPRTRYSRRSQLSRRRPACVHVGPSLLAPRLAASAPFLLGLLLTLAVVGHDRPTSTRASTRSTTRRTTSSACPAPGSPALVMALGYAAISSWRPGSCWSCCCSCARLWLTWAAAGRLAAAGALRRRPRRPTRRRLAGMCGAMGPGGAVGAGCRSS